MADSALWHPQALMATVKRDERVIVRGEGAYVWDSAGNRLLDAPASLWYCNVGHGRAEIADAVRRQMAELEAYSTFQGYANRPALELAERLVSIVPIEQSKIFLTSGGSDSIETAAKLARRFWVLSGEPAKRTIVTRDGCYHGLHGFGTSMAGLEFNHDGYGELMPEMARIRPTDAEALRALVEREGADTIAAFFCEPVIGTGGVVPPPPGYLTAVAEICAEHDILLVADEVITGFGRTGEMFACERFGIVPDMLVMAKGITSGYLPLGGVAIAERIWQPFWEDGSELIFRNGVTYSGHPTVCAAALANLDIIEREQLPARVRELEQPLLSALAPLADHPAVKEVRGGVGLLAGVQLHSAELAAAVVGRCYEQGVLTRLLANATLHVSPPFVIEPDEIARIAEVVAEALSIKQPPRSAVHR